MKAIALFNFSVFTPLEGTIRQRKIQVADARALVAEHGFVSAIGHEATAQVASELLGIDCPVNRVQFEQAVGQSALVIRLRVRQPEGAILSREQLDAIGYDLLLMERLD